MATTSLIDQLTEVAADLVKDSRADAKPILKEGKRLAKAQSKADSGKKKPKKKHRIRKLLLLSLLAGAGVALARKLRSGGPDWQSPAPGKHAAPQADEPQADQPVEPHAADDASGASPDEALADAAEEPHPVTTPDSPAEVVELDDADKS